MSRRQLLDCGLDYVILAFDGATKETYEKYRVGAVFEKTRENILAFLEKKLDRLMQELEELRKEIRRR